MGLLSLGAFCAEDYKSASRDGTARRLRTGSLVVPMQKFARRIWNSIGRHMDTNWPSGKTITVS